MGNINFFNDPLLNKHKLTDINYETVIRYRNSYTDPDFILKTVTVFVEPFFITLGRTMKIFIFKVRQWDPPLIGSGGLEPLEK